MTARRIDSAGSQREVDLRARFRFSAAGDEQARKRGAAVRKATGQSKYAPAWYQAVTGKTR